MFNVSIPSGNVPNGHNGEDPQRIRKITQHSPPNHTTQPLCVVYRRCAKSIGQPPNFQHFSELRRNLRVPDFQGGIREPHSFPTTGVVRYVLSRGAVKLVLVLTDDSP